MEELWIQINHYLKESISAPGYQTFVSSVHPLSFSDRILTIQVPNMFSQQWVKEKCEPLIHAKFSDYIDLIDYQVSHNDIISMSPQLDLFEPKPPENSISLDFNPKYSFENFIVGHNNRFAYAASEAVAKTPAKAYNPLFIYGSVGLGKTHLLHAIGTAINQKFPRLKIKFVSSEKFTNELINSIKDKKMDLFRMQYRKADILMVDDIQFLAGKEQTQEEFFHTFNELHCCNKQIILTSDRPPKEIPTLEARLRTRFEWGLIADIQPPDFETRIAILKKKVELENLYISDEILHFIATQIPTNVREMEGALTRIFAYASLLNTEVTLSMASNVIRDMVGIKQEKPISISFIKQKVCDYFNITVTDLCSKNRTKELSHARQIAMYLARELTNVSLPKIGETFGNRDHSTVMHACDKIKNQIEKDPDIQSLVKALIINIKTPE